METCQIYIGKNKQIDLKQLQYTHVLFILTTRTSRRFRPLESDLTEATKRNAQLH